MSIIHSSSAVHFRAAHAGVSMIEVLVALFILSVGLLGVAGLQAQGIRAGHSATLRSMAVFKSIEVVEAVRANHAGLLAGDYNINLGLGQQNNCDQGTAVAAICTPAQMAQNDVFVWRSSLALLFPRDINGLAATGSIVTTATGLLTVAINWSERGIDMNYTTEVQIP